MSILPFLRRAASVVAAHLLGVRCRSRLAELHLESETARRRAELARPARAR